MLFDWFAKQFLLRTQSIVLMTQNSQVINAPHATVQAKSDWCNNCKNGIKNVAILRQPHPNP